uniref:Uncharacterized protein n=1 Tax=Arundo donax TaxID=35708 RepID=A0A0A8YKW1_ARUDO
MPAGPSVGASHKLMRCCLDVSRRFDRLQAGLSVGAPR